MPLPRLEPRLSRLPKHSNPGLPSSFSGKMLLERLEKQQMWNFLRLGLLLSCLLVSDCVAFCDESEEGKVKPMFEDGKFKCSDGYDPDTDATLHPPGQDSRSREMVNAQAQAEHEKKVAQEGGSASAGDGSAAKSESGPKTDEIGKTDKVAGPDKKDAEKKDDKKDDKKDEKKDDKKDEKSKSNSSGLDLNKASNPMNRALFAIQSKNYQASVDLLSGILKSDVKNAQAHYLLAVSYVGLRRYVDAREQYGIVLKSAADPKLVDLAKNGLQRISGSALSP